MNTCAECLMALSTARVADINPGSAIALHCYTCPDCNRVADEVRYAEYRLASSLNEATPSTGGYELAAWALVESERVRRKRIARWIRGVLAVIALGIFGAAMEAFTEDDADRRQHLITETVELRCLSPEAAAELVTPYLRQSGSVVYNARGIRAITIRGRVEEVAEAKMVVDRLDKTGECIVLPGTSPAPATSVGTPGKD